MAINLLTHWRHHGHCSISDHVSGEYHHYTIRELVEEDLDSLLDLYGHLHDSDDPQPSRDQVESVWSEALGNNCIRYFGYFVDGRLIRSCTATVVPNLTRACRPYAVVENVVTHRQFRKRGCGKAVLQAALDFAWRMNCYKVMLMTGRLNESTFSFYESVGFRRDKKQAFVAEPNSQ
ncbi:MAG TPA: GNAT family N-acetyltransferase [Gammaproteobacteria bacterium]